MSKFAALTKIFLTLLISVTSLLTQAVLALLALCAIEFVVLLLTGTLRRNAKALVLLVFFAVILYGIQLIFGTLHEAALISALRMLIMSVSILMMLAVTKTQQITAALVKQCRMPHSYAFMITAVLRFVPDLLAENKAVREAQACRGYRPPKNPLKRLISYMTVIKPMVFRAIQRSEHMAISLELRGFSNVEKRTFMAETRLGGVDYLTMAVSLALCCFVVGYF